MDIAEKEALLEALTIDIWFDIIIFINYFLINCIFKHLFLLVLFNPQSMIIKFNKFTKFIIFHNPLL